MTTRHMALDWGTMLLMKCGMQMTNFMSNSILDCAKDARDAAVAASCGLFQVPFGQPINSYQQADPMTSETAASSAKACGSSNHLDLHAHMSSPNTLVGVT